MIGEQAERLETPEPTIPMHQDGERNDGVQHAEVHAPPSSHTLPPTTPPPAAPRPAAVVGPRPRPPVAPARVGPGTGRRARRDDPPPPDPLGAVRPSPPARPARQPPPPRRFLGLPKKTAVAIVADLTSLQAALRHDILDLLARPEVRTRLETILTDPAAASQAEYLRALDLLMSYVLPNPKQGGDGGPATVHLHVNVPRPPKDITP